jgi:dihydrofolate reductase
MATNPFKITIHMVSSLDGYIAKKDNSVSWFETTDNYEQGVVVNEQQAAEFLKTIDCYVMGSHTYELALQLSKTYGWPYGDTPTFVLSKRKLPIERQNVEIYPGDPETLVNERLKPKYRNVWVAGGAELTNEFIRLNLVDEIRQSILPIILGDGKLFFDHIMQEKTLHLKKVTAYRSGMVELCYELLK